MEVIRSRIGKVLIGNGLLTDDEELSQEEYEKIISNTDSLSLISFVVALEEEFGIEFAVDILVPEFLCSLEFITDYIKSNAKL